MDKPWVNHFDFSIDDYSGFVSTSEKASTLVREYEVATTSGFVITKHPKGFGNCCKFFFFCVWIFLKCLHLSKLVWPFLFLNGSRLYRPLNKSHSKTRKTPNLNYYIFWAKSFSSRSMFSPVMRYPSRNVIYDIFYCHARDVSIACIETNKITVYISLRHCHVQLNIISHGLTCLCSYPVAHMLRPRLKLHHNSFCF